MDLTSKCMSVSLIQHPLNCFIQQTQEGTTSFLTA